uniref:GRANULINS domain-containing protein n=1 Tax=Steinernema glaseri TaxID=37863 RepID=A0A1I7Y8T8_9BILA
MKTIAAVLLLAIMASGTAGQCGEGTVCGQGCCPLPNAVCCPGNVFCCPNGWKCDDEGSCVQGPGSRNFTAIDVVFPSGTNATDPDVFLLPSLFTM